MITLLRVDDRLLHGQVIHAWVPFTHSDMLVVVADSEALVFIEKELTALALEIGCEVKALRVDEAPSFLNDEGLAERRVFVVFSSIADAVSVYEAGFSFTALNIGNIHHAAYKTKLSPSVMITEEEERALGALRALGVIVEARALPEEQGREAQVYEKDLSYTE